MSLIAQIECGTVNVGGAPREDTAAESQINDPRLLDRKHAQSLTLVDSQDIGFECPFERLSVSNNHCKLMCQFMIRAQ